MSGESIGMMEGAFFVSKGVILEWMNELLDVSKFISLLTFSLASTHQNRAMRHCGCLLPDHGRHLSRNILIVKSQVGSQVRLRVRRELQGAAECLRQEWHKEAHRCGQAGEGQVPR